MIWTKMFIEAHIPTYPCEKMEHSLVHKGFLASAPDFTFAVLSVENLRTSEFTWKKTCCQTTPNNGFQVWKHQRVSGPSWNAQKWNKKYLIENLLELKFAANHQMCMRNVVALWSFVSTRCPKDMLRCNQIMWQGYFIFSISEFGKVHAQNTSANYLLPKNYAIFQYFSSNTKHCEPGSNQSNTSRTSTTSGPFRNPVVFLRSGFRPCSSKIDKWECDYITNKTKEICQ